MTGKAKDMHGLRFGRLLVLERAQNAPDGSARWRCVCDCGNERRIVAAKLRAGLHKSCGCASPRFKPRHGETHGMAGTRTYSIWLGMLARCSERATGKSRRLYFDKGIRVCERWHDFGTFLADMGPAPEGLTIDRFDGTKGYSLSNCRWATKKEQANNTAVNVLITHDSRTQTLAQWAEEIRVKGNTLLYRLRRGLSIERAMQRTVIPPSTIAKQRRAKPCAVCGETFTPRPAQLRNGHGRFCSQACNGFARAAGI